jgi:hypothetical protein
MAKALQHEPRIGPLHARRVDAGGRRGRLMRHMSEGTNAE